jgi:arylsulfatase A-like enzyme
MKLRIIAIALVLTSTLAYNQTKTPNNYDLMKNHNQKPNIVLLYVDDLGFADIGVNGAVGVNTPNIDKLATNGLNFSDAHSSAATCTPSRYSLLTGEYAFRNNAAILPGNAPLLIRPGTPTLPGMLQKAGYKTAVIGKWHLGLGNGNLDWNESIKPGPNDIGFNYSFLIPATGDRVPCVFVENDKVVNLDPNDPIKVNYKSRIGDEPTGTLNPELVRMKADNQHSQAIVNGISRIGYMTGGEKALWKDEEFPTIMTSKAIHFINENKHNPFFLFFSFHEIHVPRINNKKFEGASTMGPRGDAIAQMDWCTGEIIKALNRNGLSENTLVIFTSDNGPVLYDGYDDLAMEKLGTHNPSGPFRGGKYSSFESGTRIPTITYWPSKIKPGLSSALMNQVDIYASLAHLVGQELSLSEAPDSKNVMDAYLGENSKGREVMLEESYALSIRKGQWKYIRPVEKGKRIPTWIADKNIESGLSRKPQLFNLNDDPGEQNNLAPTNAELVRELDSQLQEIIDRTTIRPNNQ